MTEIKVSGAERATGQSLDEDVLQDEAEWRDALSKVDVPRDIDLGGPWSPAVVLRIGKSAVRIGIEDVADDEDGHWIPNRDVTWARITQADGTLGKQAKAASDILKLGDVVLVRKLLKEDGSFDRWSLRQTSEVQGAFMAMDVNSGRVLAMQGGFSYETTVFNRSTQADRQPGSSFKPFVYAAALDSGYSPATIIVDAPIEIDTPGWVVASPKCFKKVLWPNTFAYGYRAISQPHDHSTGARGRHGCDRRVCRALWCL